MSFPLPSYSPAPPPPFTILIIGAGVFGLSTTLSFLLSPNYKSTHITLLDTHAPLPSSTSCESYNPNAASIDNSRIIRADYSNPLYTRLAEKAQNIWRDEYAEKGIYWESGVAIVGERRKNGWEYIEKSRMNVATKARSKSKDNIQELSDPEEIKQVLRTGGSSGSAGYINHGSGWADAAAAMAYVRQQVDEEAKRQERTVWKRGQAVELLNSEPGHSAQPSTTTRKTQRVFGVRLAGGETLHADLTILATGAWTGRLLDLRGRAEATAQILTYIPLTPSERAHLQSMPVLLNLATGLFAVPPSPAPDSLFKIARHGYGYRNPTSVTDPKTGISRTVSLPAEHFTPIPPEGENVCRAFLGKLVPWLADRPFAHTRMCWYTDTPTGNFIIDWHPEIDGLFLTTGGSGHAFKFLPVVGRLVVEALEGRLGGEFRALWKWPEEAVDGFGGTDDGSRGGRRGMILGKECDRGKGEGREGGSKL